MKIHYLHQSGGHVLSAPSGATYEFIEDSDGRRVAEVEDHLDSEWFLQQRNGMGQPLFDALNKIKPKPAKAPKTPTPIRPLAEPVCDEPMTAGVDELMPAEEPAAMPTAEADPFAFEATDH